MSGSGKILFKSKIRLVETYQNFGKGKILAKIENLA